MMNTRSLLGLLAVAGAMSGVPAAWAEEPRVIAETGDHKPCDPAVDLNCNSNGLAHAAGDVRSDTPDAKNGAKAPGVGLGTTKRQTRDVPVDTGTTGTTGMQQNEPSANGGIMGSATRGR